MAAAAVAAGCDGQNNGTIGFEIRDSAGVEIVESSTPALRGAAAWTVDPEPIMQIGAVEAAEPYVFTRIWDATRLSDGRVVVVDEMTLEIRVFDSAGQHLVTFGGPGPGPQEFGGPPFVEVVDENTLVAWDGGHLRLSWFGASGRLLEQVSLQPQLAQLGVMAFRNGRVWEIDAEGRLLSTGPLRPSRAEGLHDSYRRIAVIEDGGEASYDLGTFVSGQSFMVRLDRMSIGIGNPYAPASAAALVAGDRVAIGSGSSWEVRLIDPPETVVRIMRAAIPRTPVTEQLEEAGLARAREMAEGSPLGLRQAEDAFAQIPARQCADRRSNQIGRRNALGRATYGLMVGGR